MRKIEIYSDINSILFFFSDCEYNKFTNKIMDELIKNKIPELLLENISNKKVNTNREQMDMEKNTFTIISNFIYISDKLIEVK